MDVRVALAERSYDIVIGRGLMGHVGPRAAKLRAITHVILIADQNVQTYARQVAESFADAEVDVDILTIQPGEQSKSASTLAALWESVLDAGADRKTVIGAVGGGVVGDLAGFVAATFARGLDFIQCPTTLLAAVDSSVGGKTGINLEQAKNMVGAFWQPRAVFVDTDALETLPPREFQAGLAEVVKYGVILDADFFQFLESQVFEINARQPEVLAEVIARCCRLKADVVEADERETTGLRAVLNYGHTFAHALEAITGYGQLLHGEAVSIGMLCASRLAETMGRIDHETTVRQHNLLSAFGCPTQLPDVDLELLVRLMQHDKKVEHGRLRFVLPTRLGHVELVADVDPQLVQSALTNAE